MATRSHFSLTWASTRWSLPSKPPRLALPRPAPSLPPLHVRQPRQRVGAPADKFLRRSQLEWMNPALTANFEQTRTNAFQTRFLKICHERRELDSLPRGPKVVLASMASLDAGPARGLVSEWPSNSRNLVIFPTSPPVGTLAERVQRAPPGHSVRIRVTTRVPLVGEELRQYEADQKEEADAADPGDAGPSGAGSGTPGKGPPAEEVAPAAEGASAQARLESPGVKEKRAGKRGLGGGRKGGKRGRGRTGSTGRVVRTVAGALARLASGGATGRRRADEVLCEGFERDPDLPAELPPVFPFDYERPEQTDFGEELGQDLLEGWLGMQAGGGGKPPPPPSAHDPQPMTLEPPPLPSKEEKAGPTKVVASEMNILLMCGKLTVDFDAVADQFSLCTVMHQLAPRELVLLGSAEKVPQGFLDMLRERAGVPVLIPEGNMEMALTSVGRAARFGLADDIHRSAGFKQVGEYHIARLRGLLRPGMVLATPEGPVPIMGPLDQEEPLEQQDGESQHVCVQTRGMGLTDIKQVVAKAGLQSKFAGGTLLCPGGTVLTHSDGDNRLVMEGAVNADFFKVRKLVHDTYYIS